MSLSPAALRVLRAVAATIVTDAPAELGDRVAQKVASLPRAADRAELDLLLRALESRVLNLLLSGMPRPFTRMSPAQRERCLRGWALSRLPQRRKAFQALKRLTTVTHYTTPGTARAIGYPGPLGPPPNTAKSIRPLTITGRTLLDCDVVVVGSGAGGGVVAAELAAGGKDVIVLEKGGYRNEADFTHVEGEALESMYDAAGLLATRDLGLVVLQGATLGGGTVINYTTSFPTPPSVRHEWATKHGLPHFESKEFNVSLHKVGNRIGVNTDHAKPSGRDRVLIRGLEQLGWHHGLLPRDVRGCTQDDSCGYCGFGCRRGAKQSTLITYLQDAANHGARMVVNCDVRRVLIERGTATGVEAQVGRFALTVRAKTVVVAGGSIHSPALLLRSGVRLPALGRHLALHPATAVLAEMDEDVRPWTGTVQAHYSDQFADLHQGYGFKFETAPVHPSLLALAAPWESAAQHRERMAQLPRTALVGILLRDRFGGRVSVDRDGTPVIDYRLSRYDRAHLRRALAAAAELMEAADARQIWVPLARDLRYRPGENARADWLRRVDAAGWGPNELLLVTFHQMSSCRMGANRRSSVVDAENRVWGIRNLYVADASTFPSASGVNPMLTVMAIAHRAARMIL
ncbi:MAG TPA: GMC family oxidoreductase N-terminal domain-containing protein [Gemmatimonadales bacterium]|nr:GMC family oxidoreductase N-terminal domain-containing protein [Gemmatimonadales bacterium]